MKNALFILLVVVGVLLFGCGAAPEAPAPEGPTEPTQTYSCPDGSIVVDIAECSAEAAEDETPPEPAETVTPPAAEEPAATEEPAVPNEPAATEPPACQNVEGGECNLKTFDCCAGLDCVRPGYSLLYYCVQAPNAPRPKPPLEGLSGEGERCEYALVNGTELPKCSEPFACSRGSMDNRYCVMPKNCTVNSTGATGCIRAADTWTQKESCGFHENTQDIRYYCDDEGYVVK